MSNELEVWLDVDFLDAPVRVGTLAHDRGTVRFAYETPWLRLEFLETATQVNTLLDGVADAVWDEAVCWSLEHPGSSKQLLELSYQAWIDGDFEEIDQISSLHSRNRFPPIKNTLISARNCRWLPIIRELAHSATEPTLVLVGVAHIGGSEGLLSKLAAGGLKLHALVDQ